MSLLAGGAGFAPHMFRRFAQYHSPLIVRSGCHGSRIRIASG